MKCTPSFPIFTSFLPMPRCPPLTPFDYIQKLRLFFPSGVVSAFVLVLISASTSVTVHCVVQILASRLLMLLVISIHIRNGAIIIMSIVMMMNQHWRWSWWGKWRRWWFQWWRWCWCRWTRSGAATRTGCTSAPCGRPSPGHSSESGPHRLSKLDNKTYNFFLFSHTIDSDFVGKN